MNKEAIGYYQSNIKTSRNEDSVYAIKYASQQMLINKLQQENKKLKHYKKLYQILKREKEELRSWLEEHWEQSQDIWFVKIINKMKELEESKNE